MTYRSQAVPSYAAYGGVPEEDAYGGASLEIGLSPAQRSAKIAERKKKLQEQQNRLNKTYQNSDYKGSIPTNEQEEYLYYFNRDKEDICKNEGGMRPYAYLDTAKKPNTTIGCGINLDQTRGVKTYHAQTRKLLTPQEYAYEDARLKRSHHPDYLASYYEDKSNIRIAPEENDRIMREKYKDAYNVVIKQYPNFREYTEGQQKALMDMSYALGQSKFSKYKNMRAAIHNNNWEQAAKESWRNGSGIERNIDTMKNFYPKINTDAFTKEKK